MFRQFVQCSAVIAAIGLLFATADNANAWHRSGGSHGSHGSFGGVFGGSHGSHGGFGGAFRGSHGGSFGGFFRHHHGSNGGYGSHGGSASACDCGKVEQSDDADHVDMDDQGHVPAPDERVIREESRGETNKEAKADDTNRSADESK